MADILVLCAHNDDQVIGVGGTIIKYSKQGKIVKTVVFSYGEKIQPHMKTEVVSKIRKKEGNKSDRLLGGSGIIYLGLKDLTLAKELQQKEMQNKIAEIIKKEKPKKIFTHSSTDRHPDHKAVYNLVQEFIKTKKINCEVYSFDVWTIFEVEKNKPKLVVDVTNNFEQKLEALFIQKSQRWIIFSLLFNICLKAIVNGWFYKGKYIEVFQKIK